MIINYSCIMLFLLNIVVQKLENAGKSIAEINIPRVKIVQYYKVSSNVVVFCNKLKLYLHRMSFTLHFNDFKF